MDIKNVLRRMLNQEDLSRQDMHDILIGITKEEFAPEQVAA